MSIKRYKSACPSDDYVSPDGKYILFEDYEALERCVTGAVVDLENLLLIHAGTDTGVELERVIDRLGGGKG